MSDRWCATPLCVSLYVVLLFLLLLLLWLLSVIDKFIKARAFCAGKNTTSSYYTHLALDYALPRILALASDDDRSALLLLLLLLLFVLILIVNQHSDIVLTLLIAVLPGIAAATRRYLDIQVQFNISIVNSVD
jgi:hypothetical protein